MTHKQALNLPVHIPQEILDGMRAELDAEAKQFEKNLREVVRSIPEEA